LKTEKRRTFTVSTQRKKGPANGDDPRPTLAHQSSYTPGCVWSWARKMAWQTGCTVARSLVAVRLHPTAVRDSRSNKISFEPFSRTLAPLSLLLSRSSLHRARPVKHRQPVSSAIVSPLRGVRTHRWVDAPPLSGFTMWPIGLVSSRSAVLDPERASASIGSSTSLEANRSMVDNGTPRCWGLSV
jgi:hypothetical protein